MFHTFLCTQRWGIPAAAPQHTIGNTVSALILGGEGQHSGDSASGVHSDKGFRKLLYLWSASAKIAGVLSCKGCRCLKGQWSLLRSLVAELLRFYCSPFPFQGILSWDPFWWPAVPAWGMVWQVKLFFSMELFYEIILRFHASLGCCSFLIVCRSSSWDSFLCVYLINHCFVSGQRPGCPILPYRRHHSSSFFFF